MSAAEKKILAQRDQLLYELASSHKAESEARRRVAQVDKALHKAEDDRYDVYVRRARDPAKHDDNEAAAHEFELNLARENVDSAATELDAAAAASRQVDAELAALAEQHLDVFSAEAEEATQAAMAALKKLAAPYAEAHKAWRAAQAAWAPLAPALFLACVAAEDSEGVWRDHGTVRDLARVPDLPLPSPGFLAGIPDPRPAALSQEPAQEIEVIQG